MYLQKRTVLQAQPSRTFFNAFFEVVSESPWNSGIRRDLLGPDLLLAAKYLNALG